MRKTKLVTKLIAVLTLITSLVLTREVMKPKERYVAMLQEALPKSVSVYVSGELEGHRGRFLGSGVYISKRGHVLTAAHLFSMDKMTGITVCDYQGTCTGAELLYKEDNKDLALLKSGFDDTPVAKLADPRKLKVGQEVLAIGNPLGLNNSVCHGIISALYRDEIGGMYNMTQSDTMINPGNSGGPLFNLNGELVGINSSIVPVVPFLPINSGLAFSVQSGQIIEFLTRFKNRTRFK